MTIQFIFPSNKPNPFRPPELNVQIWNKLSHLCKFSSESVSARGVQNCSLAEHVVDELLLNTECRHFLWKRVRERFGMRKQRSRFLQPPKNTPAKQASYRCSLILRNEMTEA